MILNIKHQTKYNFSSCVPRLIQSLRLYPSQCKNQKVINWNIYSSSGLIEKSYKDSLGHQIYNIYSDDLKGNQIITSEGKVETKDFNGVMHDLTDKVNMFDVCGAGDSFLNIGLQIRMHWQTKHFSGYLL